MFVGGNESREGKGRCESDRGRKEGRKERDCVVVIVADPKECQKDR